MRNGGNLVGGSRPFTIYKAGRRNRGAIHVFIYNFIPPVSRMLIAPSPEQLFPFTAPPAQLLPHTEF